MKYKNILFVEAILAAFMLISTPVLSSICKTTSITKEVSKSTEIVTFEVYECIGGEHKKTTKVLPMEEAMEFKESWKNIQESKLSLQEKVEKEMNLLKRYNLVPQDLSVEDLQRIVDKKMPKLLPWNIVAAIIFYGFGATLVLGTHTLLPTIGLDILLLNIGLFVVEMAGPFGYDTAFSSLGGLVLGFAGFLILGFFGVYSPIIFGVGFSGVALWHEL